MVSTAFIDIPDNFNFRSTVYSHGWCELAPFALDVEKWRLSYVFRDEKFGAIPAEIYEEKGKIKIDLVGKRLDADILVRDVRHLLRLDDDLNGFYNVIAGHERLNWVGKHLAGRMLRSPTVWEDLVKTICTTNCSWSLTKMMVGNLVEKLGDKGEPPASAGGLTEASDDGSLTRVSGAGSRADAGGSPFPTPAAMALMSEGFFRDEIRAGYRSPYFVELSEAVASGKFNPEKWLNTELSTADLKKEIKKVKGVGDYAAENLLKLVGRYDGLALDSWLRSQFYKNHNGDKKCDDKKIEKHYKKFGEWRGLVIWCDMTEKWITA